LLALINGIGHAHLGAHALRISWLSSCAAGFAGGSLALLASVAGAIRRVDQAKAEADRAC
jgi:hypothetical protein